MIGKIPALWSKDEIQVGKERYAAAEHGLQLICPNPLPGGEGHYVVFNSGHSYHAPELRFSYMVFPRVGDWAVVKVGKNAAGSGSVTNVAETILTSGFFDEKWQGTVMAE
jgi:hypothetical protein